jgi:hypothetical protein
MVLKKKVAFSSRKYFGQQGYCNISDACELIGT